MSTSRRGPGGTGNLQLALQVALCQWIRPSPRALPIVAGHWQPTMYDLAYDLSWVTACHTTCLGSNGLPYDLSRVDGLPYDMSTMRRGMRKCTRGLGRTFSDSHSCAAATRAYMEAMPALSRAAASTQLCSAVASALPRPCTLQASPRARGALSRAGLTRRAEDVKGVCRRLNAARSATGTPRCSSELGHTGGAADQHGPAWPKFIRWAS